MSRNIFVGCKIPTGLMLQLRNPEGQVIQEVALAGAMRQGDPLQPAPNTLKENGIGLTTVDADFWAEWEKWASANRFAPYINGFIFAAEKESSVVAEAKEKIKEKTRLEGLDFEGDDPRTAEFKKAGIKAEK